MADVVLHTAGADLFGAIARSDLVSLRHALSLEGEDIEARDCVGRTPLHLAIVTGSPQVCQCLLDHGARIDAWTKGGEATVHLAAKRGNLDILVAIMGAVESYSSSRQHIANSTDKTVDVNCLTQKHRMSSLYIAATLGELQIHAPI